MKNIKILFLFFCLTSSIISFEAKTNEITKLGKPILIQGKKGPIKVEKDGLAHPAVYDWNQDGKKDLIIGEYEGYEGKAKFRVFLNIGTDANPKFSGKSFYGKDAEGDLIYVVTC
jgi:hypothetical protein